MISHAAQKIRNTLTRDVVDDRPIELKRQQWEDSARTQPTPLGVKVRYLETGGVPCLVCLPDKPTSTTTIVYFHGGGLVEGSVETHRIWTCRLAAHTGCKVVSVDYRLAPEHPFPAAVDDANAVCASLSSHVDFSNGICIGADSTGSVLALMVMLNAKSSHANKPDSAFLLSPSIDLTFSGASIESNASFDPLVSLDVLTHCSELYAGGKNRHDPDISPLFAELHNLPPLLILVDDQEILLDDATRLANKVVASGGMATLHVTHGLWHVWPVWGDFPESTIAMNLIAQHITHPSSDKQL